MSLFSFRKELCSKIGIFGKFLVKVGVYYGVENWVYIRKNKCCEYFYK